MRISPTRGLPDTLVRLLAPTSGGFSRASALSWTASDLRLDESVEEWGLTPFMERAAYALVERGSAKGPVSYGELAERRAAPRRPGGRRVLRRLGKS